MADYASRVEGSQKMFEIYGLNAIRSDIMTRYLLREDDLLADAIEWVGEQERKLERIDAERRREVMRWTKVGAIAAIFAAISSCIAAYPVIQTFLSE